MSKGADAEHITIVAQSNHEFRHFHFDRMRAHAQRARALRCLELNFCPRQVPVYDDCAMIMMLASRSTTCTIDSRMRAVLFTF